VSHRRIYAAEAWHELREGLRGSLVPLMFVGLVGYVFLMLTNAEYLREMGGADVPRNSSLIVFQMTAGQNFWLIFAWAWVFAQVVARDQAASLHEVVLASPVSLQKLLWARFAGASALACVLGSSSSIALLLVPLLGELNIVPAEAVGPTPYLAIAWAWLAFVLPTAVGLGALYVVAGLRTRSSLGPFAASAVVILLWMAAMVVLRAGDIALDLATWMDVSGFGEAERQTKLWTPVEKASGLLQLTPALLVSRALWTLLPLALLALTLSRTRREGLVTGFGALATREQEAAAPAHAPPVARIASAPPATAPGSAVSRMPSGRAALSVFWMEARWHLRRATRGWVFGVAVGLWTVINVAGPFVHMVAHVEGPLVPRAKLLAPFLVDLCYVFSAFVVSGFVGALARGDDRAGLSEMLDTTPTPDGVRLLGRAAAGAALTLVLALVPSLSAWIVMALASGAELELLDPVAFNGLVAAPALLELCGLTLFIHAAVRSAGTAHALSMLAAFIAIVNHETGIVSYPPAQLGIPAPVALSELGGFSPWLAPLLGLDALKLSLLALLVGLAWLVLPRGTDSGWRWRWSAAVQRGRRGGGVLVLAGALGVALMATLAHEQLVVRGGFEGPLERDAEDAAWERDQSGSAGAYTLTGGEVNARFEPVERRVHSTWTLRGVRSDSGELRGNTPFGMTVTRATVQSVERPVRAEHDELIVALGACPEHGCEVTLEVRVDARGWPLDERPPWLHASGIWARASDVLPRLGYDGERPLRSPARRSELGLPESPPPRPTAGALVPAGAAVAPTGDWRWRLSAPAQGIATSVAGGARGPLDFALVWLPEPAPIQHAGSGTSIWHGRAQARVAEEIADDLAAMRACVERRWGRAPIVASLVQAPRSLGELALHGDLLWLPEHAGWDVGPQGVGRSKRRAALARALIARQLAVDADLRAEPGSRWLLDGVAGWMGLECVRASDGNAAWLALLDRQSEAVAATLGALDAPITALADDGAAPWIAAYAPLATLAWATPLGAERATNAIDGVLRAVRSGRAVRDALADAVGPKTATQLLGVPMASDVSVAADGPAVRTHGERFRWLAGGWQPDATAFEVVRRYDDDARPAQLSRVPTTLDGEHPFTVFDASPSYERSPLDNSWRAAGSGMTRASAVGGAAR
jgi:hypothetical protein